VKEIKKANRKKINKLLWILAALMIFGNYQVSSEVINQKITLNKSRIKPYKNYREGEVIVKFNKAAKRSNVSDVADSISANVSTSYGAINKVNGNEYALLRSKTKTT